jgi:hypothetical protein
MDIQQFEAKIQSLLPVGADINNPGGGKSKVLSYSNQNIVYQRKNSKIMVSFSDLYKAYLTFNGQTVSTTDLRDFAPQVFDSKKGGHSCNCTFLFSILELIGIVEDIEGEGRANHPFYVKIGR